jgi:hypothetical protein
MSIINPSSMIVTVLMGKLKTDPRQAHWIFCLLSTVCNTPIMLIDMTINAIMFVTKGLKFTRYAIPRKSSTNAYK